MITDEEYSRWLRRPNVRRILLVNMEHSNGAEYLADRPYISQPEDSLPNQPYNDLLSGVFDITSRLDAALSLGGLELVDDGSLSTWVNYYWRGYPVEFRLGDPEWNWDDFRIIAKQVNAGIQESRRGKLVFGLYDASAQLDKPIERPIINEQPVPLVLGEVFGAPAVRLNTQALAYQVSWLPVTSVVVRDGTGPVISHNSDYSNGQVTLSAYTPRTIACEIKEPHNTAALILQWVADQYGIDLVPVSLPDYTLGLRYDGDVSGRQILDDVCQAIGANWSISLQGELVIKRLSLPDQVDFQLFADDIVQDKIALIRTEEPWKQLKLNFARNYTPMSEVAGSIHDTSPILAERLRNEWQAETQQLSLPDYPLAPEKILDTAIVNRNDALTEITRRMTIRNIRREVWEVEVFMVWRGDIVGSSVQIHHPRLAGRTGRIISARMSPTQDKTVLEVWY